MAMYLSCGHREDDFDKHHNILTKEWEITHDGWVKAVGYKTVCLSCYNAYEKDELLLDEQEAMEWLKS